MFDDGVDAMSDGKNGDADETLAYRLLNERVRGHVHGRRSCVHHQNLCVPGGWGLLGM